MATAELDQAAILDSLRSRRPRGRWGIGTAKSYLDVTPPNLFDVSPTEWQAAIEKASSTLTWCEEEATIEPLPWSVLGEEGRDRLGRNMELLPVKRAVKPAGLDGFVLAFDYTLTTVDEDRDFDVLEPKGATVDMLGPLLFNHVTIQPIGKPLKILKQNNKRLAEQSAIMDFPFGRDVAQMIEFQVLRRMSHGFLPTKYEERKPKKGESEDDAVGWHILEYEIMERSVVSVASNRGAIIEAWNLLGEKGFHDDRMKGWCKSVYEARPAMVQGVSLSSNAELAKAQLEAACVLAKAPAVRQFRVEVDGWDRKVPSGTTGPTDPAEPKKRKLSQCRLCAHEMIPGPLGGDVCDTCDPEGIKQERQEYIRQLDEQYEKTLRHTRLQKDFNVPGEFLEPSKLEYDWAARFIGCEVKDIFRLSFRVSQARMGTWLTGLRHRLADYELVDVRNISESGQEMPPLYEVVQLNSRLSDDFLVEGLAFYRSRSTKLCIRFAPTFNGLRLIVYADWQQKDEARKIVADVWVWARENNFLKGEAFSLCGDFLNRDGEKWGDVFLDQKNIGAIQKAVAALNKKGAHARNRGMIFMGPPGTGKTLSGRVMLREAQATFIWISARDFYETGAFGGFMHGFELARELAPSVLFVEDVDNWMNEWTTDLLRTEMDGIAQSSGVLTVLTTNYPERLPEALIDRPGRFHDVLRFALPDEKVREVMLRTWLPEADAKDRGRVVKNTADYSGAHLRELAHLAVTLHEDDGVPWSRALSEALAKVIEQRQVINDAQLEGSNYRPTRRAIAACKTAGLFSDNRTVPANPSNGSGNGVEGTWRKLRLEDFADDSWEDLSAAKKQAVGKHFAWYPDLETFGGLKLGHHFPPGHESAGKASLNGVRNALARANQVQGLSGDELERVEAHLRAHLPERQVTVERCIEVLTDLLRLGEHDGKCTVEPSNQPACDLHIAAMSKRIEAANTLVGELSACTDDLLGATTTLAMDTAANLDEVLRSLGAIELTNDGDDKRTTCEQVLAWLAAATAEELEQVSQMIEGVASNRERSRWRRFLDGLLK